jgi:glycosyltransferase involved in cell wall biosynthesis
MDKVSIIIPVYNTEEYILKCISSVSDQKIGAFSLEVIIINDGSKDSSLEIIERFMKSDRSCEWKIINRKNGGLSRARNQGLEECSGDFIYFLDSDDYLNSDSILVLMECAKKYEADLVIGKQVVFNSRGMSNNYTDHLFAVEGHVDIKEKMNILNVVSACSKLYRKSLLEDDLFPNGLLHEDNYFSMLVFDRAKKIIISSKSLYFRRLRESLDNKSITQSLGYHSFKDYIDNYKLLLPKISEKNRNIIFRTSIPNIRSYIVKKLPKARWGMGFTLAIKTLILLALNDRKNSLRYLLLNHNID